MKNMTFGVLSAAHPSIYVIFDHLPTQRLTERIDQDNFHFSPICIRHVDYFGPYASRDV